LQFPLFASVAYGSLVTRQPTQVLLIGLTEFGLSVPTELVVAAKLRSLPELQSELTSGKKIVL
jgi:hypothetical protein